MDADNDPPPMASGVCLFCDRFVDVSTGIKGLKIEAFEKHRWSGLKEASVLVIGFAFGSLYLVNATNYIITVRVLETHLRIRDGLLTSVAFLCASLVLSLYSVCSFVVLFYCS